MPRDIVTVFLPFISGKALFSADKFSFGVGGGTKSGAFTFNVLGGRFLRHRRTFAPSWLVLLISKASCAFSC